MYTLRAVQGTKIVGMLPDYSKLEITSQFSDVGVVRVDYALDGVNVNHFQDQRQVAVYDSLGELADSRWTVEGSNGNVVSREGVNYRQFQGRNTWKALEESLVYAPGWPSDAGKGVYAFENRSVGYILDALFAKARQMGDFAGYTWSFTQAKDSAGANWDQAFTLSYDMGVSLLQVVQNMTDSGWAEFAVIGREVRAYKVGTLGTDRTKGQAPIILWENRNTIEVPEQTDSRTLRTVALIKGDDGVFREAENASAKGLYGRRTLFISQGGTKDPNTLSALAKTEIDRVSRIRSERTYKYALGPGVPVPYRDFQPGDYLLQQHRGQMERVRVRQITISVTDSDPTGTATLVLNDKFQELDIALSRKVKGIAGGSTGGSGPNPITNVDASDLMAPGKVLGLSGDTLAYTELGRTRAQILYTWTPIATNADGSPLSDLGGYEFRWRYANEPGYPRGNLQASDPPFLVAGLLPDQNVTAQVRAIDRVGNIGEWSDVYGIRTAKDAEPPPVPSKPTITPWLGALRIQWDGLGVGGAAQPPDFLFCEIHVSSTSNFTPSATTLYDRVVGGGFATLTDQPYDAPRYVRLVGVDVNGNRSGPSEQVSATAKRLVEADIGQEAVTRAKLALRAVGTVQIEQGSITADSGILASLSVLNANIGTAAVTNAKIFDATIQNAKIASVEVGKLTAGNLFADMTVSARIKTADFGARAEMNAAGFFVYDSNGNRTVRMSTSGIEIVGQYSSGYNNNRQVVMSSSLSGAVGRGANQAGLIFPTELSAIRYSQIFDDGLALRLDSPSFDTGNNKGASFAVHKEGLFGYTHGVSPNDGRDSFYLANNGNWGMGPVVDRGGRVYGSTNFWTIRTDGGGSSAYGSSGGYWEIGTMNNAGTRLWGDTATWRLGTENSSAYAYGTNSGYTFFGDGRSSGGRFEGSNGGFTIGLIGGQGIFSNGSEQMVIQGGFTTDSIYMNPRGNFVRVQGNCYISGNFGVGGSKQFVMVHPLDPDRMLVHAATESPHSGVEYWGEGRIRVDGQSTITLPDYFEALTLAEFRAASATAIGAAVPLGVSRIRNGQFVVRGLAGTEFTWFVKAARKGMEFDPEPTKVEAETMHGSGDHKPPVGNLHRPDPSAVNFEPAG